MIFLTRTEKLYSSYSYHHKDHLGTTIVIPLDYQWSQHVSQVISSNFSINSTFPDPLCIGNLILWDYSLSDPSGIPWDYLMGF